MLSLAKLYLRQTTAPDAAEGSFLPIWMSFAARNRFNAGGQTRITE